MMLSHAAQGSFLSSFLTDSDSMDPEQRGLFLEEPPEGAPDIDKAHEVVLLCFHLQAYWDDREKKRKRKSHAERALRLERNPRLLNPSDYREQVFSPCVDALGQLQHIPALIPMLLPRILFNIVQPRAYS